MTFSKKITLLSLVGIFIFGTAVIAQPTQQAEEVTDREIGQFASSLQEVQQINQQAQEKMVKAIEDEGLEVQRFNEIQQSQQVPDQPSDATEKELKIYQSAVSKLQVIQNNAQQKMEEKITDEGLTVMRYQEIMGMIQSDAALQQRLQKHLEE
jgi:hypothetical protein